MSWKKKIFIIIAVLVCIPIALIGFCYFYYDYTVYGRIFDNVEEVPVHEYGLLFGTSSVTPEGDPNDEFDNRIKAAVELYKAGKIKWIIVSGCGDWHDKEGNLEEFPNGHYNDLMDMQNSLYECGVPVRDIVLDGDGSSTLNSIIKAKEVYGLDSCVIISQPYHNKQVMKLADRYGLKTVAYNALPSRILRDTMKNPVSEILARVKFYIAPRQDKKPHFDTYAVRVGSGIVQEWKDIKYSVPGMPNAVTHMNQMAVFPDSYKYISTYEDKSVYYNSTHGFYVSLPAGMGYNQCGEDGMACHSNEFYNNDTTLVVSAGGMYYDALLQDYPHFADTLKSQEREYLIELGNCKPREVSPNVWVSEGRVNHAIPGNPPADRFIRKWLLKKDNNNRDSYMSLEIYFNDSLEYRLPEFKRIIDRFPGVPVCK